MCLSCGQWWGSQIPLYDPPAKDETIYLDANHAFYPDERKVSEDFCPFWPHSDFRRRRDDHHQPDPVIVPALPHLPDLFTSPQPFTSYLHQLLLSVILV